jgi:hypothetical protein
MTLDFIRCKCILTPYRRAPYAIQFVIHRCIVAGMKAQIVAVVLRGVETVCASLFWPEGFSKMGLNLFREYSAGVLVGKDGESSTFHPNSPDNQVCYGEDRAYDHGQKVGRQHGRVWPNRSSTRRDSGEKQRQRGMSFQDDT